MSTRTASRPIEATMIDPSLGLPTITMAVPMPGFPAHREFVLVRLNDDGLLYAFTSIQDPELRFLVAPPEPFFPDYAPEVEPEVFGPEHQGHRPPPAADGHHRRRGRDHRQPAGADRARPGLHAGDAGGAERLRVPGSRDHAPGVLTTRPRRGRRDRDRARCVRPRMEEGTGRCLC